MRTWLAKDQDAPEAVAWLGPGIGLYCFGFFILDYRNMVLTHRGIPIRLGSRAMALLATLVAAGGNPVSRRILKVGAWPDTFVEDANLRVQISSLRRTLREVAGPGSYVINEPDQGYRLDLPSSQIGPSDLESPESEAGMRPPVRPSVCVGHVLAFGRFRLDVTRGKLFEHGNEVNLGGRAITILATLLQRPGKLVTKEELCRVAWPERPGTDVNLRVQLTSIRRALNDRAADPRQITNVSGRGYRFIGPVTSHTIPTVSNTERNPNLGEQRRAI